MPRKWKSPFFGCLVKIQHGDYDPWEGICRGVIKGPLDTAFYLIESDNGKIYHIPVCEIGFLSILEQPKEQTQHNEPAVIIQIKHLKLLKG